MSSSTILFIAAWVGAGFAWGLCGRAVTRRLAGRRSWNRVGGYALLGVIAVPVVSILLAKLFDSAVLGWMFGLSLMLLVGLIPCGVLFGAGWLVGSSIVRWRTARGPAGPSRQVAERAEATAARERDPV